MSREELEKRILEARYNLVSSKDKETIDILEELAIKALEQEPIEVEATKLQMAYNQGFEDCRKAVMDLLSEAGKLSLLAMVADLPSVNPQPCEDAISKQEVLDILVEYDNYMKFDVYSEIFDSINKLPSVNPQEPKYCDRNICIKNEYNGIGCDECEVTKSQEPRMGHWIEDAKTYYEELNKRGLGVDEYTPYFTDDIACSECLAKYSMLDNETQFFKYCPNCGAKMESEDKE